MEQKKERPILFSGPMVRAILDGRKTQTRRIVKPNHLEMVEAVLVTNGQWVFETLDYSLTTPYGKPGDSLWVRESWRIGAWNEYGEFCIDYIADNSARKEWLRCYDGDMFERLQMQSTDDCDKSDIKMVDGGWTWKPGESPCRVRPSIHMPRWASRITLDITGVRVERLQDISKEDAMAEGLKCLTKDLPTYKYGIPDRDELPGNDDFGWPWEEWKVDPRKSYKTLWEKINGPGSWDTNPWVWVIEFSVRLPD